MERVVTTCDHVIALGHAATLRLAVAVEASWSVLGPRSVCRGFDAERQLEAERL